mgnify:CR=1 FL=1
MSLDFYHWFCRDVLRLPDEAARREACCRENERRIQLRKIQEQKTQESLGSHKSRDAQVFQLEGDGDITVYPNFAGVGADPCAR